MVYYEAYFKGYKSTARWTGVQVRSEIVPESSVHRMGVHRPTWECCSLSSEPCCDQLCWTLLGFYRDLIVQAWTLDWVGRPSKACLSRLLRAPFLVVRQQACSGRRKGIDLLLNENRSENLLWSAKRWEGRVKGLKFALYTLGRRERERFYFV